MAVTGPFTARDVQALGGRKAILYREVAGARHSYLVLVESVCLSDQEPGSLGMSLTEYEIDGQVCGPDQRTAFYLPPNGSYELV